MCNGNTITTPFYTQSQKTWLGTTKWDVKPGGWTLGAFSFEDLFKEHQAFRNTWTASNSGLDLARYLGCKLTCMAHPTLAYIIWWDPDYHTLDEQAPYIHPAILMNKKNHRVILPLIFTRKATVKIRIPPPSTYEKDWRFSKDMKDMGLFAFGACLYDWKFPFAAPNANIPTGTSAQSDYWWVKWNTGLTTPNWLQLWGSDSGEAQKSVRFGPFVQKGLTSAEIPAQLFFKYKFTFEFGGEVLPPETVADPANPEKPPGSGRYIGTARLNPIWKVPDPQHPKHPSKRHIKRLLSGGECSPDTWSRLADPSTCSDYTTLSESDRSVPDGLYLRRKKKTTQKETSEMPAPRGHRVQRLCFDSFLRHLEHELGRELSTQEKLLATERFRNQKKKRPKKKDGAASSTSTPASRWSLCC